MIVELIPPIKGLSKGFPVNREQPGTSGYMNNVRPRDVLEKRIRLGQRPGLDKWGTGRVGDTDNPIVYMCTITSVS